MARRSDERLLPFIDCHIITALAAGGRVDAARDMADAMAGAGGIFAGVAAPVSEALIAHRAGAYADAAQLLQGVRQKIITRGGSHAQRDVFELVLKDAEGRA